MTLEQKREAARACEAWEESAEQTTAAPVQTAAPVSTAPVAPCQKAWPSCVTATIFGLLT